MRIENLMTRRVVSVAPHTSLKEVARLLVARRISGVPVCDADGRVVGVLSETDIVAKAEGVADHAGGALQWLYGESVPLVAVRTAGEAMTSPPIVIEPSATVAEAARLMAGEHVNRLPVVAGEGELVGIVTRADLVAAYARNDAEVAREIYQDVLMRTLWIEPGRVDVEVVEGRVTLRGELETRSEAELVAVHVGRVPGVVDVEAGALAWRDDDLGRRRSLAELAGRG